jgi:hypothetical protein
VSDGVHGNENKSRENAVRESMISGFLNDISNTNLII